MIMPFPFQGDDSQVNWATLDSDLQDWVDVVGSPSNILAINTLVIALKAAGIWTELDLFHIIGGLDTDTQRLRPLITTSATKTFTAVASPTLAYNGVTGNGSTSYLNLNWTPSTNGVKFVLNSASLGIYSRTDLNDGSIDIGTNDGTPYRSYLTSRSAGSMNGYINNNSNIAKTNPNSLGLHSIQRRTSILAHLYKNGSSLGTDTNATTGVSPLQMFLCARNGNGSPLGFTTRNLSMCFAGSGSFNQATFYTLIQTYMTSVGLNV